MHPDAQTNASETEYFFLGNGQITAVLQWSRNREMSPYGLLLWGPDLFPRKESTFLFHPESGLGETMLTLTIDSNEYQATHEKTRVRWESIDPLTPVVSVEWEAGPVQITERFSIQQVDAFAEDEVEIQTFLVREVYLDLDHSSTERKKQHINAEIRLGIKPNPYLFSALPSWNEEEHRFIIDGYVLLTVASTKETKQFERFLRIDQSVAQEESLPPRFFYHIPPDVFDRPILNHHGSTEPLTRQSNELTPNSDFCERVLSQLGKSRIGINSCVSNAGAFDASIWQYGYEWGQDAAMVASACCCSGDFEIAESILINILEDLTSLGGQIVESSRFREGELTELNANGAVLLALRDYTRATGDISLIREGWERISDIASLLLQPDSIHRSGLIHGRRDLWERLPWMGLKSGFEVATNTFCAEGLIAGAELASIVGSNDVASRWKRAAEAMRQAMIHHSSLSFVEDGRIIHRRLLDGSVQREMVPEAAYHDKRYTPYIPKEIPDLSPQLCDPDSVSALPILYDIVDPRSKLARTTLDYLYKHLWNPTGIGGYARSPLPSDPDSPGPWPFVTAWMAEAELKAGLIDRAQQTTEWLLKMAGEGGSWFEYYGERESPPYPPVGIIVWGWAQYILLVVRGWMGIEVLSDRVRIAPRLLPYQHRFCVGDYYIDISVSGIDHGRIDETSVRLVDRGIEISLPLRQNHKVEFSE